MTSDSKKFQNSIVLLLSVFYILVGLIELGYFVIENFSVPAHIPVLGVLGLIIGYGVLKMKKWALPIVIGFFFVGITFGVTTLANSIALQTFEGAILFHLALIIYMILLLVASASILIKRETFN
jgi:hypothetical protein